MTYKDPHQLATQSYLRTLLDTSPGGAFERATQATRRSTLGPLSGLMHSRADLPMATLSVAATAERLAATGKAIGGVANSIAEAERVLSSAVGASSLLNVIGASSATPTALQVTDFVALFRMPKLDETRQLLREALRTRSIASQFLADDLQGAMLRAKLDTLSTPWLHSQGALSSFRAMAEIQALGHIATRPPFASAAVAAIRAELGDWRDPITALDPAWIKPDARWRLYEDRGFDTALTDFTPAAFHEGMALAGLVLPAQEEDAPGGDLARARGAFRRLQALEVEVRQFLTAVMEAAFGPEWVRQRTPGDMFERWLGKKAKAEQDTDLDLSLIEYADFTDYKLIIERTDNWDAVFKAVFRRPEDVRESFQRLFPVRIATMHARGITLEDELLLIVETGRISAALKRRPN